MNPTIIAIALGIWIATGLGSWFYRGHMDEAAIHDAQDKVIAATAQAATAAKTAADEATKKAQDAADQRAASFQQTIDDQRSTYEKQLADSRAKLRHLPACPVPVADISLLLDYPKDRDSRRTQADPGPVPGGQTGGTVDASAIIANCEFNRGSFERNRARLNQCITDYDAARTEVNTPTK